MIDIKEIYTAKRPGQSAREYYLNKRVIWWLREEITKHNNDIMLQKFMDTLDQLKQDEAQLEEVKASKTKINILEDPFAKHYMYKNSNKSNSIQ